jgi:RNA polymerase sigma-70 factor (ECF subfamily)
VQEDVDFVFDPESIENPLAASASLAVLMRLPTSQRSAVILMDVLGYSLKELSEIINASIPATKSLLHRGREALRHVVNDDADPRSATLDAADRRRLAAYVDKFNARDFDALRDMLSDDVKLELVAHSERRGKVEVGGYFSNYAKLSDWRMRLGTVENEHAVVVFLEQNLTPSYFILLEWNGERIARIRDFRYARYVMEAVDLVA